MSKRIRKTCNVSCKRSIPSSEISCQRELSFWMDKYLLKLCEDTKEKTEQRYRDLIRESKNQFQTELLNLIVGYRVSFFSNLVNLSLSYANHLKGI